MYFRLILCAYSHAQAVFPTRLRAQANESVREFASKTFLAGEFSPWSIARGPSRKNNRQPCCPRLYAPSLMYAVRVDGIFHFCVESHAFV